MTDSKKSYYAVIPANIRYDESLPPNAKLLYGEITALCNAEGYCWASNKYFAELYGVSVVSISKWINALIKNGYIASHYIYKEGTKEIDKRYITILYEGIKEKFNTSLTEVNTPNKEKFKDNNTSLNNTLNNTNEYVGDSDKPKRTRFTPPSLEEVQAYCRERQKGVNAEKWYNHYSAVGWKVGRNPMKDWKAAVRTWEQNEQKEEAVKEDNSRYGGTVL